MCEHLKTPIILGRDFSIQNCIGISWTKTNTHQLTQNNEVIAETTEYQTPSRSSVSLKKNVKVPPQSCTVVDVDINTTEEIKVEVMPDQLWLSANPNICTYPMIAHLKDREMNTVTPFIIVNFSHHEHLHLSKYHVYHVSAPRGVSAPSGGVCSRGVCSQGMGMSAPRGCLLWGVSAFRGCLLQGGYLLPGVGCIPACTEADTPP